jgi:hypothetical protein
MKLFLRTWYTWLSLGFSLRHTSASYSDKTCCALSKDVRQLLVGQNGTYLQPTIDTRVCGQEFGTNVLPAPNAYVIYRHCAERCEGFDVSKPSEPSTWAAPVVQFILPSISSLSHPSCIFNPLQIRITGLKYRCWVSMMVAETRRLRIFGPCKHFGKCCVNPHHSGLR